MFNKIHALEDIPTEHQDMQCSCIEPVEDGMCSIHSTMMNELECLQENKQGAGKYHASSAAFQLNLSVMPPYNADFDGGKMNMHEETHAEHIQRAPDPKSSNPVFDDGILIENGKITSGIVGKKTISASQGGLVHVVCHEKGPEVIHDLFMSRGRYSR
ncbi:hypothetical protein AZE42_05070 [Rhizopogon vesiculosus]|uniref:DNA-directed RNA polymerase n=1 Tax=Rhizopogon vesiculosus TaxID=180088 RepID=A0A1J8QAN3_9AGAM|nr:hypothetical protein AZE42_05070 [Rhizopogon vesiculosus]